MTDETPPDPLKQLKDYFFNLILYRQSNDIPKLLEKYPEAVHWQFTQGLTPLMEAVMQQHHEITKMLLDAGARVDDRGFSGVNPMYYAGRSLGSIDLLLEHGADINAKTDNGDTALCNAIDNHDTPAALKLIERGADIEVRNWDSCTPLLKAVYNGDAPLCSALLRAGADIAAVDMQGRNALAKAQWGRDNNTDNARFLRVLDVLEPVFAAKSKEEMRLALNAIEKEVEQGMEKPVTVGKALRFRPRSFYRFGLKV